MSGDSLYDMSEVAPHKRKEVLRRIAIVEAYLADEITSSDAVSQLGMSIPSFWRLVRAWRRGKQPGAIGGSGRMSKPKRAIADEAKQIIREAESLLANDSISKVVSFAMQLGRERATRMPSEKMAARYATDCRRGRGLRPDGITDLVLEFCVVDIPACHPTLGLVAPVMCVLLDVRKTAVVLGLTLAFEGRDAPQAARTILDAIARADSSRLGDVHEFQIPGFEGEAWRGFSRGLEEIGVAVRMEPVRPRSSARGLTKLIGKHPAGLHLLPDLTIRPPAERLLNVQSGDPIDILDAEHMLRGRFLLHFPGRREALSNNADNRSRLSAFLQKIASGS